MRKIIDRQLNELIKESPKHDVPKAVMEKAIVPVLKQFLKGLKHSEYFVLKSQDDNWLVTTIKNSRNNITKEVIYAFSTLPDAFKSASGMPSDFKIVPLPVAEILFSLSSTTEIDCIIFMDTPNDPIRGKTIDISYLMESIELEVKAKFSKFPSNLA
jgi:hypothetical protein